MSNNNNNLPPLSSKTPSSFPSLEKQESTKDQKTTTVDVVAKQTLQSLAPLTRSKSPEPKKDHKLMEKNSNPIFGVNRLEFMEQDPLAFAKISNLQKQVNSAPTILKKKEETKKNPSPLASDVNTLPIPLVNMDDLALETEKYIQELKSSEQFFRDDHSVIFTFRGFIKNQCSDWMAKTIVSNKKVLTKTATLILKHLKTSKANSVLESINLFFKDLLGKEIFALILKNIKDSRKETQALMSIELKDCLISLSEKVKKQFTLIKFDIDSVEQMANAFTYDAEEANQYIKEDIGKELFMVISTNIVESLNESFESPMPKQLKNFLIHLNSLVKKKFPDCDSESLVFKSFMFRFVFNTLIDVGNQAVKKVDLFEAWGFDRNKVIVGLNKYINELQSIPENLKILFQNDDNNNKNMS